MMSKLVRNYFMVNFKVMIYYKFDIINLKQKQEELNYETSGD